MRIIKKYPKITFGVLIFLVCVALFGVYSGYMKVNNALDSIKAYTANHTNNGVRIRVADINEATYGALDIPTYPLKQVAVFETATARDFCDPKERVYIVEPLNRPGYSYPDPRDSQSVTPQATITETVGTPIDTPVGGYKISHSDSNTATATQDATKL